MLLLRVKKCATCSSVREKISILSARRRGCLSFFFEGSAIPLLTDDMVKLIKADRRWSERLRNIVQRPKKGKGTEAKKK